MKDIIEDEIVVLKIDEQGQIYYYPKGQEQFFESKRSDGQAQSIVQHDGKDDQEGKFFFAPEIKQQATEQQQHILQIDASSAKLIE